MRYCGADCRQKAPFHEHMTRRRNRLTIGNHSPSQSTKRASAASPAPKISHALDLRQICSQNQGHHCFEGKPGKEIGFRDIIKTVNQRTLPGLIVEEMQCDCLKQSAAVAADTPAGNVSGAGLISFKKRLHADCRFKI
jgi:hypothetical protein